MGKSKAPKPPDPYKVADAQQQTNIATAREQARLNAIDQYGPYGSATYMFDPDTNTPIGQQIRLSPELQKLFDSQIGTQQGISAATANALGFLPSQAFDPSGLIVSEESRPLLGWWDEACDLGACALEFPSI